MTGEPVVTPDPVVALLYGVLAYPSLRPGVSTTVDLLAGQPGPWTLPDVERAAAAEDLHARLVAGHARQVQMALEVAGPSLRGAVEQVRRVLGSEDLAAELDRTGVLELAFALDHRAEQLLSALDTAEARLATTTPAQEEPAAPTPPALDSMVEWRRDQLIAHLVERHLDPQAAMEHLRATAVRLGKVEPRTWTQVAGRRELLHALCEWIAGELEAGHGQAPKAAS